MTETIECVQPKRLAVFGFVDENAGSQASASYVVLESILQQGHTVDLYAIDGFVTPGRLAEFPNLTYVPLRVAWCATVWMWLKNVDNKRLNSIFEFAFAKVSFFFHTRKIRQKLQAAHLARPYDALLSFGLLSPWRLRNARTISWPQGPPSGELGWMLRNIRPLVRRLGLCYVFLLIMLYFWKCVVAVRAHRRSDIIIGGSRWTLSMWRRLGVASERLVSLPYPVDLSRFSPSSVSSDSANALPSAFQFLHLGRLVPRKRLDLLLESFTRVLKTDPSARLLIVGGFSYATAYKSLLEEYSTCPNIEYQERIPRTEVCDLLRNVQCSLQTSENEDFGSTIAESLSCGTPVVLGPSNGTADYLPDCCQTFSSYDPETISQAMLATIQRVRSEKQSTAAACRQSAEMWFDATAISTNLLRHICLPENDANPA